MLAGLKEASRGTVPRWPSQQGGCLQTTWFPAHRPERLVRIFGGLVILAATLALVLAAPAQAGDRRHPGQRPANDPVLTAMLSAGQTFWEARGVQSPCGDTTLLDVADDLNGPDAPYGANGRPWSPLFGHETCRIVLDSHWAGARLHSLRRARPRWWRRVNARALCRTVVHEGHVRGLEQPSQA